MSTITFDTQELVHELSAAGLPQTQADAVVRAIVKSHAELVTREYLDHKIDSSLAPVKAELLLVKWMLSVVLAGIASLVLNAFF